MSDSGPIIEALRKLVGTDRFVVYDVPPAERPTRAGPMTPFVMGGDAWWRFVRRRKELDDGWLTVLVSVRRLPEEEALLAVDWGTMFANAMLLVEPHQDIEPLQGSRRPEGDLERQLRESFGVWRYWRLSPDGALKPGREELDLGGTRTIAQVLEERLPRVFPPEEFRASLFALNAREMDLFVGRPVGRVVLPFLTRLGLPVPYDPRLLIEAVRDLVDRGLAYVEDPRGERTTYHGPEKTLPPDLPLERLAEMVRV
jgi:hypothetical protein